MSDDVKREDLPHGDLIKKILGAFNEYVESLSDEELQEFLDSLEEKPPFPEGNTEKSDE